MDEQQRQFKESWERIDSRSTKWVTRSAEKMAMWAHSGRSEYDIKRKIREYSSLSTRNRYIHVVTPWNWFWLTFDDEELESAKVKVRSTIHAAFHKLETI